MKFVVAVGLVVSLMLVGSNSLAESPVPDAKTETEPESVFKPLFDGKTLKGWWQHDRVPEAHRGGKWDVADGNLMGVQYPADRGGFLATQEKFGDFILRFEVKLDYPTDSGVFLRMGDDGKSHQVTLDNRPGGDFGAIYLPWTQASVFKNPEGIKHFRQKEWNTGQIRIEGDPARIRFWLNGTLVTDFQHTPETSRGVPRSGYIGLQVHPTVKTHVNYKAGNQVRYRNIRIFPLGSANSPRPAEEANGKARVKP